MALKRLTKTLIAQPLQASHHITEFKPYHLPMSAEVTGIEPTNEEAALQALEWESMSRVLPANQITETQAGVPMEIQSSINVDEGGPTYLTHQEDDIDICSRFLVGKCLQGILCPRHHTLLPYTWQLRVANTGIWYTVDLSGQETLERLFCDPKRTQIKLVNRGQQFILDFTTMVIHHSPVFDRARRLSTCTSPSVPLHTCYKYYYEEEGDNWVEYNPTFVARIEEGLREGYHRVLCSSFQFKYILHLDKSYQENMATGTKRRMRARPVFRSPAAMMFDIWSLSNLGDAAGSSVNCPPSLGHREKLPLYPEICLTNNRSLIYDIIPLRYGDREFPYVYRYFHKTMPETKYIILEICRVQNYFQWEKYTRKRAHMSFKCSEVNRYCVERHLFHGTDHSLVEAICSQNFDPRVSGKHGTSYGQGCYFATTSSYCHRYSTSSTSGHHFMFLAKVLVGHPAVGNASFRRPPPKKPKDPASPLYDSCVSRSKDPDIFVLFDNDQFYPYYLIKYQKIQDVVEVDCGHGIRSIAPVFSITNPIPGVLGALQSQSLQVNHINTPPGGPDRPRGGWQPYTTYRNPTPSIPSTYHSPLPFGLASAPRIFTNIMAALDAFIHAQGISLTLYLDDFLIKAPSGELLARYVQDCARTTAGF
ncbi:protein mono-ADP-ribosyltransferase TIPARP-like [Rhinophrynus dorsalis]